METMNFEADVKPDAHGIIDGRMLAHQLVKHAYAALTPYTQACPSCTNELFSIILNTAVAELFAAKDRTGSLPGMLHGVKDVSRKDQKAHVARIRKEVMTMLECAASSDAIE